MFRRILVILGALVLLVSFFFTTSTVSAVPRSTSSVAVSSLVNVTSLQKTCSVVDIKLNGANHTVTCRHPKAKGVSPAIYRDNACNESNDTLDIYNYGFSASLCFEGYGYMPVAIYQVNEVYNLSAPSCFDYTQPGGSHTTYFTQGGQSQWFGSYSVTNITVTYMAIGQLYQNFC